MNEHEFSDTLETILGEIAWMDEDDKELCWCEADVDHLDECETTSFRSGGVLTDNAGFTVKLADGSEYQITVIKSA